MSLKTGDDEPRASFIERRLGSAAARFRSAVTLGFLCVAVGALAGAPGARTLVADESLWPFASLFGRPAQPAERSYDVAVAPRRVHHTAHRHLWRAPRNGLAPLPLGRQSICVRTCDGYAFPVGAYHGEDDRASHEAACRSACPDAATALYLLPGGSDRIGAAVNIASGRPYSALPDAFHYANVLDEACTCHRPRPGTAHPVRPARPDAAARGCGDDRARLPGVSRRGQFPLPPLGLPHPLAQPRPA